jgi:hypothetical protein
MRVQMPEGCWVLLQWLGRLCWVLLLQAGVVVAAH